MMRIAVAVVLTALFLSAPARAQVSPQVSPAEVAKYQGDGTKIRLMDNPLGTNAFARYVMQKYQLPKKYNFELEIIPYTNTPAQIGILQSGNADIGTLNWIDVSRLRIAGVNVVGVGPMIKWADHFVVPVNSPVKNVGDLKGKKIGIVNRTNLNWLVMKTVGLKEYKIDLEKEAQAVEGGPTLMRGLLELGQVDAALSFNIFTPGLLEGGKFRVLAKTRDLTVQLGLPDVAFVFYVANGSYAAAHPANIRAFLAALREAVAILKTNDQVWHEQAREMKLDEASVPKLREEMRADLLSSFDAETEPTVRKTFELLLSNAGHEVLGFREMPNGFMTMQYQ
jgi:NitT/TauT family transport system substrate-binding protein